MITCVKCPICGEELDEYDYVYVDEDDEYIACDHCITKEDEENYGPLREKYGWDCEDLFVEIDDEPDPDRLYDEMRDREMEERYAEEV